MTIKIGPTGGIIKGDVLDVNRKHLERALKDYDPQLYIKWNPTRLKGWGAWEIRRRPETKSVKDIVVFEGNTYVDIEYVEVDILHGIMAVSFLNYNIISKLQSMDTWKLHGDRGKNFSKNIDYDAAKHREARDKKANEERRHAAKVYKSEIRDFKEYILSGNNPADIAKFWHDKKGS